MLCYKKWKLFKVSGSCGDYVSYQTARNIATKAIKEAKRTFELNLANGVKMIKSFWAYIRSKTKTKTTMGPLQDQIGELIDYDESLYNMLNKLFTSVFTKEDLSYIPNVVRWILMIVILNLTIL